MNYVEILCAGILCMFKYCFVCLDNVCSITCTLKYCMLKKVFVQKLSAEICVCPKICRSCKHYSECIPINPLLEKLGHMDKFVLCPKMGHGLDNPSIFSVFKSVP